LLAGDRKGCLHARAKRVSVDSQTVLHRCGEKWVAEDDA
jgi:hypothetical protein